MNDVKLNGVKFAFSGDSEQARGFAAVAERDLSWIDGEPLMIIPRDLILSSQAVEEHAKSDQNLREVLAAVGDLAHSARGAILIFLLVQITISSPGRIRRVGVSGPWTEYVKFLSAVSLPTTWTDEEQALLMGTSLQAALDAKLKRLSCEFEQLQSSTITIPWCEKVWWTDDESRLTFEDWMLVDSWYRSRALSFAHTGDAMVPCIDMMNHSIGEQTSAYFDRDSDGNAVLLLPNSKTFHVGDELTISYGDGKSASEMLFSYGFIDETTTRTSGLTLDLQIPDDDPLKKAKEAVATVDAAVRITNTEGMTAWHSLFVWLACVNEEDGLQFHVLQTNEGTRELRVFFNENDVTEDTAELVELMKSGPMWEVYQLRALALLQDRVQHQLDLLDESEPLTEDAADQTHERAQNHAAAVRLRSLESDLLKQSYSDMDEQVRNT
ncbi:MAG: hypothetical protein M1837_005027 [Sclerophora amabilis]|nr:MAG: hypothetical protein M1837_005027 [Sclerophora amabilis]